VSGDGWLIGARRPSYVGFRQLRTWRRKCSLPLCANDHPAAPAYDRGHEWAQALRGIVWDEGVSGVSTKLAERPQGRRLFDLLRAGDTLVVRWIDRLGRNYQDICETIRDFMQRGVVIRTVINGITFDGATKDPMQCAVRDALIAFMAATAQAQAEATKEAQRAGIAHAKANGDAQAYRRALLGKSSAVGEVARITGLTRQTVYRLKSDPVSAEAALMTWGL
jgi:DNA invertase Pin-like site-specific DNA recombinase